MTKFFRAGLNSKLINHRYELVGDVTKKVNGKSERECEEDLGILTSFCNTRGFNGSKNYDML
jgi:hypothetical protein